MKLSPARFLDGRLRLPGDKSISHRAAFIAALAEGSSDISNFSTAADCASTLACLRELGISIERRHDNIIFAGSEKLAAPRRPLDCGNSGSTLRILAGVLAGHDLKAELIGDESLSSRPMRRIIEPLEHMGARIESTDGKAPLKVHGSNRLSPITYKLPVASAQVKSAVLFAGLNAAGRTTVIETSPTRDHTERLFNGFGVPVTTNADLSITLDGPARFNGGSITIPGDVSSAAYFVAAAMLLPESRLTIEGVGLNPTRAAFLSVLTSWGADISTDDVQTERNEPYGTINVRGGLIGTAKDRTLSRSIIPSLIDELPLLAVVGSQIDGGIEIRDAAELRHKESDRLATTAANLRAMGAEVEEFEDGLAVSGPTQLHGALIDSHGDHRIAMAFSIAALIAEGETEIAGAECVRISFPEFFTLLESLAKKMKQRGPIIITGFMGCGKSKVAREFALRRNKVMVDLDERITMRVGRTPAQLINEDGERAFRAIETNALRELLQSGEADVIALGGGAWIEKVNRDLIDQYSCTSVWLDTPFEICWERIAASEEERPLGRTREEAQARYDRRGSIYALAKLHIPVKAEQTLDDLISAIELAADLRG